MAVRRLIPSSVAIVLSAGSHWPVSSIVVIKERGSYAFLCNGHILGEAYCFESNEDVRFIWSQHVLRGDGFKL